MLLLELILYTFLFRRLLDPFLWYQRSRLPARPMFTSRTSVSGFRLQQSMQCTWIRSTRAVMVPVDRWMHSLGILKHTDIFTGH
jgi:hypothetical protein